MSDFPLAKDIMEYSSNDLLWPSEVEERYAVITTWETDTSVFVAYGVSTETEDVSFVVLGNFEDDMEDFKQRMADEEATVVDATGEHGNSSRGVGLYADVNRPPPSDPPYANVYSYLPGLKQAA